MKIAVPTRDSLIITQNLEDATAFFVMTFRAGEIVNEELRQLEQGALIPDNPKFPQTIKDCQFVVVRSILESSCNALKQSEIQCVLTHETFITNIAIQVKEEILLKESNTCCCP